MVGIISGIISTERKLVFDLKYPCIDSMSVIKAALSSSNTMALPTSMMKLLNSIL